MFSNIGSQTSVNNIAAVLNNDLKLNISNKKIHSQTIEKYIEILLSSYIFYKVSPNYLKGKEHLRDNAKYYAADIGLRYFLLGGKIQDDAGHILENIVYIELLRRGYKVEFGKIKNKEIDFVASLPGAKLEYYQVAQTVLDDNILKRELASLQDIDDNYPKYLLTRDYNNTSYKGIEHKNVLQWLME
jgi:predicted AAA+ superfamily ATPase